MKRFAFAFACRFSLFAFGAAAVSATDSTPGRIVFAILAAFFALGGHSWLERNGFPAARDGDW